MLLKEKDFLKGKTTLSYYTVCIWKRLEMFIAPYA